MGSCADASTSALIRVKEGDTDAEGEAASPLVDAVSSRVETMDQWVGAAFNAVDVEWNAGITLGAAG